MKRLLIFAVFILVVTLNSFSQKIISDNNELKDLKVEVTKYTKVTILTTAFKLNVTVDIDAGGIWHFYDEAAQKEVKFKTNIEVLNYMYRNGWTLKDRLPSEVGQPVPQYLFEKKE